MTCRDVILLGGPHDGLTLPLETEPGHVVIVQAGSMLDWYQVMDGDAARFVPPAERVERILKLRSRRLR